MKDFTKIHNALIRTDKLDTYQKSCIINIMSNGEGFKTSLTTLSKRIPCSRDKARKLTKELQELKILKMIKVRTEGGDWDSNSYEVNEIELFKHIEVGVEKVYLDVEEVQGRRSESTQVGVEKVYGRRSESLGVGVEKATKNTNKNTNKNTKEKETPQPHLSSSELEEVFIKEFGASQYKIWLKPYRIDKTENKYKLSVPNEFTKGKWEMEYKNKLEDLLKRRLEIVIE